MKCLQCGKECSGKYCSGACRAKASRERTRTVDKRTPESARSEAHAQSASNDLIDCQGNVYTRTMLNGRPVVYPTMADLRRAQADRGKHWNDRQRKFEAVA